MELEAGMKPHEFWSKEIEAAEKRQKDFWKDGGKIVERFLDERKEDGGSNRRTAGSTQVRLNLFHANVTTLMSMLYGKVPEISSTRRFADAGDDVGRIAAEMQERILNTDVQAPGASIGDVLRACLQDRLLPGLGTARVRYDFGTKMEKAEEMEAGESGEMEAKETEYEVLDDEEAVTDYVHWRDYLWGHAHIWAEVPWTGYKVYMTKPEAVARFGTAKAEKLNFNRRSIETKEENSNKERAHPWDKAELVEIWSKTDRKVYWWSKDCDELLDEQEDPLKLRGFFPGPEPMMANSTTTLCLPRADFKIAQDLYNQIDILQTRISIITRAVKVVGVYNKASKEIKQMFNQGTENDLIAVDSWAMFAEKGGLKGQIDWLPIETIANVLKTLQEVRAQTIELLYQVTGMADILRGQSDEYAAASSDKLKAKFASVRVQCLQDEFARFASDIMSLKAEIMRTHFEVDTVIKHSNAHFFPENPQDVMAAAQFLVDPSNDILWRVEIKPESIAMVDYAQLKSERTEFLTAMATFLQSSAPLIEREPASAPFLMEMLKWSMAGFKGSQQIEGVMDKAIKQMTDSLKKQAENPQPPQDPKLQEITAKAQAEQQKIAAKAQTDFNNIQQEHYNRMQEIMAETDMNTQKEKMNAYFNVMETQLKHRATITEKTHEANLRPRPSNS